MSRRRQILLDCLLLFLGAATLVRPYFTNKYTDQWHSIESTFIADARFLLAHWPHPQWQPLWYTGTRFDYIYPPALRYGTAFISKITGYWPVKAYHFYTMLFYCLGIAGVYLLVRAGGRTRATAFFCAAAAALVSPSFFFMKDMRRDSGPLVPVRLGVLLHYGEGPHITALSLIPFAIAFTWLALERRRPVWVALAAISCAAVVSNNFYGATSLGIFYGILLWSFLITRGDRRMVWIAIAIPVLAYGLTAFWLSPSYLWITHRNLRYVALPGKLWSLWVTIAVAAVYVFVTGKLARSRPERTWAVFVTGIVLFFSLNVLGNYYVDFLVTGDPHRLVPELDLVLILGSSLVLEWLWRRGRKEGDTTGRRRWVGRAARAGVCVVLVTALAASSFYIRKAWHVVGRSPDYTKRVEYRVSDWVWTHMRGARICTAGTVRFWFDAWHDLEELGGGSEQGLLNPTNEDAQWEIGQGSDAAPSLLWLQALGVDAMYFAGPRSEEPYKDYKHQERFASWPVIFDDGLDNKLYGVPRRFPALVRVVDAARMRAEQVPRSNTDLERLGSYVDIIEHGPDTPATLDRPDTETMVVRAKVEPGQAVLVQESFDPSWQAWSDGRRVPLYKDVMGFMVAEAPPGQSEIRFQFVTPLENQIGRVITAISVLLLVWLFFRRETVR